MNLQLDYSCKKAALTIKNATSNTRFQDKKGYCDWFNLLFNLYMIIFFTFQIYFYAYIFVRIKILFFTHKNLYTFKIVKMFIHTNLILYIPNRKVFFAYIFAYMRVPKRRVVCINTNLILYSFNTTTNFC